MTDHESYVPVPDKPKQRPAHWYRIFIGECPVCGRGEEARERVYGRKPKDPRKRYVYDYTDACVSHFL